MVKELINEVEMIIAENPSEISLTRNVATKVDGSTSYEEVIIAPQRFRVYELSVRDSASDKLTEQGFKPSHVVGIVAHHDTDIMDKDRFTYRGKVYEVMYARPCEFMNQPYKISGRAKELMEEE